MLWRPGNEKKVISAALEEIRRSFIYVDHCGSLAALTVPSGIETFYPKEGKEKTVNPIFLGYSLRNHDP